MPIPLMAAASIFSAVQGLAKMGVGIGQIGHAKRMAENNVRPEYEIQDEYYNNRSLAQSMAQEGLTEESLSFYGNQAERGLQASIDAGLQGGSTQNGAASLLDRYQQSIRGVAVQSSQLQDDKRKLFMDRNADLASQKTMKWAVDKYEPYKDTALAAAQERNAGMQNVFGGGGEVVGAASSYAMSQNYADLLNQGNGAQQGSTLNRASSIREELPTTMSARVAPNLTQGLQPRPRIAMDLLNRNQPISDDDMDWYYELINK